MFKKIGLLLFTLLLVPALSSALMCKTYLTSAERSYDRTNIAYYIDRSPVEVLRSFNLTRLKGKYTSKKQDFIEILGFPHFKVEGAYQEGQILSLPLGLKFYVKVKKALLGGLNIEFLGSPETSVKLPDIEALRSQPQLSASWVREQAHTQLLNSRTFNQNTSLMATAISKQTEAFSYLLSRLESEGKGKTSEITLDDLSRVNAILTEHHMLRREDIESNSIGQIRGLGNEQRLILTGRELSFMKPHRVPEAMTSLVEKIHQINKSSSIFDIAKIYQDFILIHPFFDGNGRTSRVLLDYLMLKAGFPPIHHNQRTAHIINYSPNELAGVLAEHIRDID